MKRLVFVEAVKDDTTLQQPDSPWTFNSPNKKRLNLPQFSWTSELPQKSCWCRLKVAPWLELGLSFYEIWSDKVKHFHYTEEKSGRTRTRKIEPRNADDSGWVRKLEGQVDYSREDVFHIRICRLVLIIHILQSYFSLNFS